jgi:hypothetical protein
MMTIPEAFRAMQLAADKYVMGDATGDDLHAAVVDYTDALYPNWPTSPPDSKNGPS